MSRSVQDLISGNIDTSSFNISPFSKKLKKKSLSKLFNKQAKRALRIPGMHHFYRTFDKGASASTTTTAPALSAQSQQAIQVAQQINRAPVQRISSITSAQQPVSQLDIINAKTQAERISMRERAELDLRSRSIQNTYDIEKEKLRNALEIERTREMLQNTANVQREANAYQAEQNMLQREFQQQHQEAQLTAQQQMQSANLTFQDQQNRALQQQQQEARKMQMSEQEKTREFQRDLTEKQLGFQSEEAKLNRQARETENAANKEFQIHLENARTDLERQRMAANERSQESDQNFRKSLAEQQHQHDIESSAQQYTQNMAAIQARNELEQQNKRAEMIERLEQGKIASRERIESEKLRTKLEQAKIDQRSDERKEEREERQTESERARQHDITRMEKDADIQTKLQIVNSLNTLLSKTNRSIVDDGLLLTYALQLQKENNMGYDGIDNDIIELIQKTKEANNVLGPELQIAQQQRELAKTDIELQRGSMEAQTQQNLVDAVNDVGARINQNDTPITNQNDIITVISNAITSAISREVESLKTRDDTIDTNYRNLLSGINTLTDNLGAHINKQTNQLTDIMNQNNSQNEIYRQGLEKILTDKVQDFQAELTGFTDREEKNRLFDSINTIQSNISTIFGNETINRKSFEQIQSDLTNLNQQIGAVSNSTNTRDANIQELQNITSQMQSVIGNYNNNPTLGVDETLLDRLAENSNELSHLQANVSDLQHKTRNVVDTTPKPSAFIQQNNQISPVFIEHDPKTGNYNMYYNNNLQQSYTLDEYGDMMKTESGVIPSNEKNAIMYLPQSKQYQSWFNTWPQQQQEQ